jgi:hypothetical protein
MTETLFPGPRLLCPFPATLGDLGEIIAVLFCSGVKLLPMKGSLVRATGCNDLALDALVWAVRVPDISTSADAPVVFVVDIAPVVSSVIRSALDATLGRLRCARAPKSASITPGPIDFLGGFPILLFDTGG